MLSRRAAPGAHVLWRTVVPSLITALVVAACVVVCLAGHTDHVNSLTIILGAAAIVAGIIGMGSDSGTLGVSASFIIAMLAAAFLGPASAALAALITELSATLRTRTRWRAVLLNNVPPALVTGIVPAVIIEALVSHPADSVAFYASVTLAAFAALVASFALFTLLRRLVFPDIEQFGLRTLLEFMPSGATSILVAVAGVGIEKKVGTAGIAFALAAVFAFSYMAQLVERSRHRAEQYASLSWGVLAGLMRSLDVRDQSAGRHSAAVARFARDIAAAVGMGAADCELAHTAGLLHDIGRFALSDRVAERGRELTEEDWMAIQRHPELGADMLRDLGMYGPVAEIVLAHHERIDGRGYPFGLSADEIPPIAKIIAVAEVYDTLTANDTYRTQMSSFEALRELRRVSGSQLDGHYVEVLADLLTGEGVEYRHADLADFDVELNMERRIREAGAGA